MLSNVGLTVIDQDVDAAVRPPLGYDFRQSGNLQQGNMDSRAKAANNEAPADNADTYLTVVHQRLLRFCVWFVISFFR